LQLLLIYSSPSERRRNYNGQTNQLRRTGVPLAPGQLLPSPPQPALAEGPSGRRRHCRERQHLRRHCRPLLALFVVAALLCLLAADAVGAVLTSGLCWSWLGSGMLLRPMGARPPRRACLGLRAAGGLASAERMLAAADGVEANKASLLDAVAATRRGTATASDVFAAARALEAAGEDAGRAVRGELVEGLWSLVYSASQDQAQAAADAGSADGLIDKLTAQVYRFFFRFAPALAGSQGGDEQRNWWGSVRNEQLVDLSAGFVRNFVDITLSMSPPPPWRLRITVEGEATPDEGGDAASLRVVFTQFGVSVVGDAPEWLRSLPALPLPRPQGSVQTTFVDEDLRVSRGGRGGLFVLRRRGSRPADDDDR